MKKVTTILYKNSFDLLLESGDEPKINEMISHKEKCLIEAINTNDIGREQLLNRQINKLKLALNEK